MDADDYIKKRILRRKRESVENAIVLMFKLALVQLAIVINSCRQDRAICLIALVTDQWIMSKCHNQILSSVDGVSGSSESLEQASNL